MDFKDKIKTREEIALIAKRLQKRGKKVGYTSGAFDILHVGHAFYLQKAKKICDVLIVGLNSDLSCRSYKGDGRPINPGKDRAFLLSSLECIDYIFIFKEIKNHKNIEIIKPDFYIKGRDYSHKDLTSKPMVEEYGGQVRLIPLLKEKSTTAIIKKISKMYSKVKKSKKTSRVIFLDRDGVLNKDIEYLHEPEKFELLPKVIEGLKKIQRLGYKLCIVTNQAGIGWGYFTKEDFFRVNKRMLQKLSYYNIEIDKIYFCPHNKKEKCGCRKPRTGMIKKAQKDLNIDLNKSFIIGDETKDIKTGANIGLKTILVRTGKGGSDKQFKVSPDFIANDLLKAALWIERIKNGMRA